MAVHKHTYAWNQLQGSAEALKWNMRDLSSIDVVLGYVPGRTCCVQAGGNLGVFAKYLSRVFTSVLTFEPSPELFPKLVANAPEPNIIRFQAALGELPGLVGLRCTRRKYKPGPVHEGLTHIHGDGPIPCVRLDDFALPVVDLLYLDLEGFESFALRGAEQTLQRCRPVIALEINVNTEFYGVSGDEVRAWLTARGYCSVLQIKSDEVFTPCH